MKRFTLIFGAVIMGFVFASCSGPSKEDILMDVNTFFTQAVDDVNAIDNAADLTSFVSTFPDKKSDFQNMLFEKFEMEDDKFVGFSEEENAEIMQSIYDKATEYNKAEYAKCGEIIEPYIAKYEEIVSTLYGKFQAGETIDEAMTADLDNALRDILQYSDIVPEELATRFYAAQAKSDEMFSKVEE